MFVFLTAGVFFPEWVNAQADDKNLSAGNNELQEILGKWIRSDGGYLLEFKDAQDDGNLTAAYYNPKSINVFRAQWQQGSDAIYILVEMQDVNYPGSTYTLRYDAETDRLTGKYFQAMDKITYDIEFLRRE